MSFVPYQVDYSVKNTAKTLGFSKKKVIFKFGFANEQALRSGQNGPSCRGSEHELVFIWSLATGKRQLLLDNKDVHYSESGQNGWTADRAWQHAFTLRDSHGGSFRVHFVTQPINKEIPNSRPFDVRIAGISYFKFNQIYQLGTPEMIVGHQHARGRRGGSRDGDEEILSAEERKQLAIAKLESLKDLREREEKEKAAKSHQSKPSESSMQRIEESLIDFGDPTPAPVGQSMSSQGSVGSSAAGQPANFFASSLTMDSSIDDRNRAYAQQPPAGGYNPFAPTPVPQTQANNPYAMPPAGSNPYATPPTNSNPYAPPPASSNPYAPPPTSSNPYQQPPQDSSGMALTTYQGPGGSNPNSYVDATGRLAMVQQQQQPLTAAYGFAQQAAAPSYNSGYPNLASPSNQSYGGQSMNSQVTYGSAPSFAQPPQQQQYQGYPPQQQQQGYSQQQGYPQQQQPSYNSFSGF